MKVGDVVNFVSNSWVTDRIYPNPGVVHEIHKYRGYATEEEVKATVLWANGKLTREHSCYLEVIRND
tara:strand:- start:187 stop:387 length:201 start_codon:yes stop_codon:yes gene_type:complete